MTNDNRTALQEGTEVSLRLTNGGTEQITVGQVIGWGGSCIVYRAACGGVTGGRRSAVVKEFYPCAVSSLARQADGSLLAPPEDRARFAVLRDKFAAGVASFESCFELDTDHAAPRPFLYAAANGTVYAVSDPSQGSVLTEIDRGELTLYRAARITLSVCNALDRFHRDPRHLLYLDCKPDNLYLSTCDHEDHVRLFDFDTVVSMDDLREHRCRFSAYSEGWAPPEQRRWETESIGPWTDLYAAGAVFFWLLTGRRPSAEPDGPYGRSDLEKLKDGEFDWRSASPLCTGASEETLSAVGRIADLALHPVPRYRYASAGEMAGDLRQLAAMTEGDERHAPIYEELQQLRRTQQESAAAAENAARQVRGEQERTREELRVHSLRTVLFGSRRRTLRTVCCLLLTAALLGGLAVLGGRAGGQAAANSASLDPSFDAHLLLELSNANHRYEMGLENWRRLDYHRAEKDISAALDEIATQKEQSETEVAVVNNSMGCLYLDMGQYEKAYEYLNGAYVTFRDNLGADSLPARAVQLSVAQYDFDTGDYESALRTTREILDASGADTETAVIAATSHIRAQVLEAEGRDDEAAALYQKVLSQYGDIAADGQLSKSLAEYADDPKLTQSEKEARTNTVRWIARTYDQLGRAQMAGGDAAGARSSLKAGLELCLSNPYIGTRSLITSGLYDGLALLDAAGGDTDSARENIDLAMRIQLNLFDFDGVYPGLVTVYDDYGSILEQSGAPQEEALDYYEKARTLALQAFGENHPQTAAACYALGLYRLHAGDAAGALDCFEEAITIRKNILGSVHTTTARYELSRAQALIALGRTQEAQESLEEAAGLCRKLDVRGQLSAEIDALLRG
jgi:tetratricopeptide (TPR) repeat protein